MVDPVQEQHGIGAGARREVLRDVGDPEARGLEIGIRRRGRIEVPPPQMARQHPAPVRRFPGVLGGQRIDLTAVAAPIQKAPDAEPGQELRELGGMSEGVRRVALPRHGPEGLAHATAEQQVAHVGLARGQ
jgi:hypothetical protein